MVGIGVMLHMSSKFDRPDGWLPTMDIESVLVSVPLAMHDLNRRPAQLDATTRSMDHDIGEAIEAYVRMCRVHGWKVPAGLSERLMAADAAARPSR
jgi:ubiquitin-conjugating enzyme E2 Q